FNHPRPPQLYTLSLHDALPICPRQEDLKESNLPLHARGERSDRAIQVDVEALGQPVGFRPRLPSAQPAEEAHELAARHVLIKQKDRKSTRLNSSHQIISYAVFC